MGLNVKKVIKEKGLSVQEVADRMNISRVGLSQHINGNPSVEVLERIAEALNVSIKELFTDDGISGFIKIHGQVHEINNIYDLERILDIVRHNEK